MESLCSQTANDLRFKSPHRFYAAATNKEDISWQLMNTAIDLAGQSITGNI